jgi:hypothetical protein
MALDPDRRHSNGSADYLLRACAKVKETSLSLKKRKMRIQAIVPEPARTTALPSKALPGFSIHTAFHDVCSTGDFAESSMNSRTGRNQPCPCGSGRKYKNCCQRRDAEAKGEVEHLHRFVDPELRRIRQVEGRVVNSVLSFVSERFGRALLRRASEDFRLETSVPENVLLESIFIPWLVFNWLPPASKGIGFGKSASPRCPLALAYLEEHERTLDEYQKNFIRTACSEPFSCFVVTGVETGRSLTVRDLFLERTVTVKEMQASQMLKRGHIVYARVISLPEQAIMLGMAPFALPPYMQNDLLDFRDDLQRMMGSRRLDREALHSLDAVIRRYYFEAEDRARNPPPPVLQNTDGDPLECSKLHYRLLCTPAHAVERLTALVLPEHKEGIFDTAEYDESANLIRITLTWAKAGNTMHPEWTNTSLGQIEIDGEAMNVEVNSARRATTIQSKIAKLLGGDAVFVKKELIPLKAPADQGESRREQSSERQDIQPIPNEVRPEIAAMMKTHWDNWLDTPLPALKGESPRQAAGTPRGRERLEALLMEMEYRNQAANRQPELLPHIEDLRKRLNMAG